MRTVWRIVGGIALIVLVFGALTWAALEMQEDLLANPSVEIVRGGRTVRASAIPEPGEEGHRRIRRLFRQKYGLADVWIGLIQDGSGSILVRVEPVAE
jgi:hypothetical protein